MKKIFFVLVAGIVIMSCNTSGKKSVDNSSAPASTNSSPTAEHSSSPNTSNVQAPTVDKSKMTTVQWLDGTEKEFPKMKEGEILNVTFRFKNTGDKPLVISQVTAGCGCTIPEQPTKPFAPGETGEIKATFNSSGKAGSNSKPVNVFANIDPPMTTLTFRVEVIKAKS